LYMPYHLFFKLPPFSFSSFGNESTYLLDWIFFFVWHYYGHMYLVHWTFATLSCAFDLYSYNFSNSCKWLVSTHIGFASHDPRIKDGKTYYVNINRCKLYTSWCGVYLVATLYAILYENKIVDRCLFL
jgi:hypothetical protein